MGISYAQSSDGLDWSTYTENWGDTGGVLRINEGCSLCGVTGGTNLVPLIGDSLVPVVYDNSYNGIYVTPTINYGYSTGYNNTYSGSSNWISGYVNPYAGLYNGGSGSSGSGSTGGSSSNVNNSNSSVNNSGNIYDNSLTNTNNSSNYSFCNGTNNCNNINTNIVSNSTNVNGNNNNVNTNANNTASQLNCGAGYNPINGNCVQDIIITTPTPTYTPTPTPTPIYINPTPVITNPIVYNATPIYNNVYNSPNYTTPIYNNIYNSGYSTPTYYNQTQYKTCNNNTTIPVWQNCYKYCSLTGQNILETENCPINYNNNYSYNNGYITPLVSVSYPTVHITANPMIVTAGESTQLAWAASNASYCTASNGWTGSPVLIGNRNVNNLIHNMTFTITCYNQNGQSSSDAVSIIVNNNAPYNKAVTTIPNNITNNSAVCNGVGIVNTHIRTNGWFEVSEYDTNNNVIRNSNTNSAYIGMSSSNYYSAPINGLKANTKYSCLAVINNSYGVWKSEAMTFRTAGSKVLYINSMLTVKKTKNTKVTTVKPITVHCVDTNGNKMTIANGKKLIAININKFNSNIVKGEVNSYTITIKNTGNVDVKDVSIQLAMDKSLIMIDNNNFETINDNGAMLYKVNIGILAKGEEKTFIVKVKTSDNIANINEDTNTNINNSVVTNITASYIVSTSKGDMKDEINVYSVDSIVDPIKVDNTNKNINNNQNTNNKSINGQDITSDDIKNIDLSKDNKGDKVKSKTLGQIIDSMSATEWLAVLAMIVIICILIRNISMAYNSKEKNSTNKI